MHAIKKEKKPAYFCFGHTYAIFIHGNPNYYLYPELTGRREDQEEVIIRVEIKRTRKKQVLFKKVCIRDEKKIKL